MNTLQVAHDRILLCLSAHHRYARCSMSGGMGNDAQVAGNRWAARLRDREGKSVFCGNAPKPPPGTLTDSRYRLPSPR